MDHVYMLDFRIEEIPCQLITISPDYRAQIEAPYYRHQHQYFELHYVYEGECELDIGDRIHEMHKDEICLIAPGIYHSVKSQPDTAGRLCIGFEVPRPSLEYKNREAVMLLETLNSLDVFRGEAGDTSQILRRIQEASGKSIHKLVVREELRALSEILVLELSQKINRKLLTDPSGDPELERICRNYKIGEFFNNSFYLRDGDEILAAELGVSRRQLNRILNEQYGMNYREKMNEVRLEISTDLLKSTQKSIGEISELMGYSCTANFCSFVKKMAGKTPLEIRKESKRQTVKEPNTYRSV